MSHDEKDKIFASLKYIYWKMNKANLPIYAVPVGLRESVITSKHMVNQLKKRVEIPERFRVADEDIYYEDPKHKRAPQADQEANGKVEEMK